jgi:hypothetical protein
MNKRHFDYLMECQFVRETASAACGHPPSELSVGCVLERPRDGRIIQIL